MKLLVLFSVFALCACGSLRTPRSTGDIKSIAESYGYHVQAYQVQTSDGYILELFRVFPQNQRKLEHSETQSDTTKPAVLLFHGYLTNSEDFVIGGPTEALAFYLVNQGYDVFLGNARGTNYGQKHTHLNPKKDEAFWRYSWHDIGTKDLPAIIDKIIEVTKQQKIHFVGHMEGTSASYALLSELPEYNNKFENVISLGPVAFLKNAQEEILTKAVSNNKAWMTKNFGVSTFNPSSEIIEEVQSQCVSQQYDESICKNVYFLVNGYNSKNFNMTTVQQVLPRLPSSGSVREFIHFVQLKKSGQFTKYDENFSAGAGQEYDLSKVTAPVAIIYTPNDHFSQEADVQTLISKLPNVFVQHSFEEFSNNLDLVYANDVENVNKLTYRYLQGNQA